MSPVLVTPRLRLRPLAGSDEALYVRLYGDTGRSANRTTPSPFPAPRSNTA